MTAVVPTAEEHDQLADRVTALEQTSELYVVRPEEFWEDGDADWTPALRRMMDHVEDSAQPDAGGSVPVVTTEVRFGSGPYVVSGTWLGDRPGRLQGLTFRGIGKRASEIVMTGPGPMLVNRDRWMNVTWYDLSFRSTTAAASFLLSTSTGAAQSWSFVQCEWRGAWEYGIGLDGPEASNTNSEWTFERCRVLGTYETAWLWSGMSPQFPQQDQFLNFALRDCHLEPTYGDMLRFDKGGFVNVSGGSWIMQGQRPGGARSRFFYFPDTGVHFDSVQNLFVTGVRFELRNATAMVIESWWKGQVTFDACEDDALGFQAFSATLVAHRYVNPSGVSYSRCPGLVGKHAYEQTAAPSRQAIVYTQCARKNNRKVTSFLVKSGALASALRIFHVHDRDGIA